MTRSHFFVTTCLAALVLTGCEMYAESNVTDRRMQVREETFTNQVAVNELDNYYIASLVQDYSQSGKGPIDLTITYDPQSKTNTAMRASDEAVRVFRALRKEGAAEVVTSVLPVREQGGESVAIISYSSYQAAGPANCGEMPGMNSPAQIDHDPSYKMGCTLESVFAKQIADPSDLLGDAKAPPYSEGRAASNVTQAQRAGAPNKPLKGVSASD